MAADHSPEPSPGSGRRGAQSATRAARPPHLQLALIVLVVVGGLLGTGGRYGLAVALPTARGTWPLATLIVNLAGAFILGVLLEGLAPHGPDVGRARQLRLFAGTGFCGGFTTYSALAVELDLLVHDHQAAIAGGYAAVTVIGGLITATAGIAAAAMYDRRRSARRPAGSDVIEEQ